MITPLPSVRINNLRFDVSLFFFNLRLPSPTASYFPSTNLNSLARASCTVSSPSSPTPPFSARLTDGSIGSGVASAVASALLARLSFAESGAGVSLVEPNAVAFATGLELAWVPKEKGEDDVDGLVA